MLKFYPHLSVIALIVLLSMTNIVAKPQFQKQQSEKHVNNSDQESDILEDGDEKDDLKGSASYGYGFYGYPYSGLYGGGGFPYTYSLHGGYGGYYPYYGGYGYPGHFF